MASELTAAERVARIQAHTKKLQALADSETLVQSNRRFWHAIYVVRNYAGTEQAVIGMVSRDTGGKWTAQLQHRYNDNGVAPSFASINSGPNSQLAEFVVFLGLDDVDPARIEWVEASLSQRVYTHKDMPGLSLPGHAKM